MQILGAEKALFRALKTRGNTPKYGLIFHSSFIGRAKVCHDLSMCMRVRFMQMTVLTASFGEKC